MRVSPKGKAVWVFRFRGPDGKEQSGTVGVVGVVTDGINAFALDDAVAHFNRVRAAAFSANQPEQLTLARAYERWKAEHKKRDGGDLSAATVEYYQENYNRYLGRFAGWVLGEVTTDDWMTVLREVQTRSSTRARGTMWMLHAVYAHFIDLDVLQTNPLAKRLVKSTFAGRTTKKVRKSQVRTPDLPRFFSGMGRLRQRTSRDAVRMAVLTGWRRSAVLRMRWDELDLEQGVYNVPPSAPGWKGFVGPMALGKYSLELLQERLAHPSAGHSPYVFPARVENGDRLWLSTIRGSIDKASEKLRYRPTPHDLRRTFVTMAELVLGNLTLVGNLVGHRHGSATGEGDTGSAITAGYVVRNLERERQAATRVQTVLLEAGGDLPLTTETWEIFEAAGVEPDAFVLGDLFEADDDDDDEGSSRGERP